MRKCRCKDSPDTNGLEGQNRMQAFEAIWMPFCVQLQLSGFQDERVHPAQDMERRSRFPHMRKAWAAAVNRTGVCVTTRCLHPFLNPITAAI